LQDRVDTIEQLNSSKDRQNFSAMKMIDAVRKQRKAIFFPAEPLEKNRLSFCYFFFGEAKKK